VLSNSNASRYSFNVSRTCFINFHRSFCFCLFASCALLRSEKFRAHCFVSWSAARSSWSNARCFDWSSASSLCRWQYINHYRFRACKDIYRWKQDTRSRHSSEKHHHGRLLRSRQSSLAHDLIVGEDSVEELKVFTEHQHALVRAPHNSTPLGINRIRYLGAVDRMVSWIKQKIRGVNPDHGQDRTYMIASTR
jgi:hypothetical protein